MPETTMTTVGNPSWIAHSGPNAEKAKAFYADVLGWTIGQIPMQDGSTHSAIMVNDAPVGGFSPATEPQGAWTIYVTVPDADAVVEKAKSAGAEVLAGPMDMPGVGRMATLRDPQGARFAVITYESMQG